MVLDIVYFHPYLGKVPILTTDGLKPPTSEVPAISFSGGTTIQGFSMKFQCVFCLSNVNMHFRVCVCVVFWAKVSKIPSKGLLHFSSFTINFFLRLGFPRMSWPVTYSMMIAWNHMKPMIACHVYHLSRTSMNFTISNISQKNIPKISPPKKKKRNMFYPNLLVQ